MGWTDKPYRVQYTIEGRFHLLVKDGGAAEPHGDEAILRNNLIEFNCGVPILDQSILASFAIDYKRLER